MNMVSIMALCEHPVDIFIQESLTKGVWLNSSNKPEKQTKKKKKKQFLCEVISALDESLQFILMTFRRRFQYFSDKDEKINFVRWTFYRNLPAWFSFIHLEAVHRNVELD